MESTRQSLSSNLDTCCGTPPLSRTLASAGEQTPEGAASSRVVDLTLTISSGMRGVEIEKLHTYNEHGWNSRLLHLYSHCGTHMDAPLHYEAGEGTIDTTPLDRCLGPAWIADLSRVSAKALITCEHIAAIARKIRPGDGLLLRTDWSRHVDQPQYYRDNFPRVSEELAHWCVERKVRLLGVEPPSVADVNNPLECDSIHKILLGARMIIVEGLANLSALRMEKVLFGALPLKIAGGDGAPCRAFAVEYGAAERDDPLRDLVGERLR